MFTGFEYGKRNSAIALLETAGYTAPLSEGARSRLIYRDRDLDGRFRAEVDHTRICGGSHARR